MKQRRINEVLRDAQRALTMETADFSCIHLMDNDAPLPKTEAEVTDFIRNRTRLWRQTWIESPINEALSLMNKTE